MRNLFVMLATFGMALAATVPAYAGSSLSDICRNTSGATMINDATIDQLNFTVEWPGTGDGQNQPAMQVHISNHDWYGYTVSGREQLASFAQLAWLYQKRINACVRSGRIIGLEGLSSKQ